MQWNDRVYGDVSITDPNILGLIARPTFQRLKGIKQAGPSAFAFPFKTVTRFEHSLGVYLLLQRLGAGPKEQVAGLLHDLSHTAFSHAVDFVISSEEQDHHESLKPIFLGRPDIVEAIRILGYRLEDFLDDSAYPLLERPLPMLCADRLDYFLRDGIACGVISRELAETILEDLAVEAETIVFRSRDVADDAVQLFAEMNRDWWASETEAFIYNEFADALREGFRLGWITKQDLFEDDETLLAKLESCSSPLIASKMHSIRNFRVESLEGYRPRVVPKMRWIEPSLASAVNSR